MRGKDPDTGEFLAPSRSQERRDALDVLKLGERLAALTDAQLAKLPLPDDLLPADWPRRRAYELFRDRHEAWAPAAQAHFDALTP